MEEISFIMDVAKEAMEKSLDHLEKAFVNIRAGKANPAMLSTVKMEYYGAQTPLSQVANINTPDAQTLSVQPWDKTMIPEIEKAILVANLGFNPSNNGESVIINIPPLTEERRRELVKLAKAEAEDFLFVQRQREVQSQYMIYDMHGRQVDQQIKAGSLHTLDVSNLSSGIYFITTQDKNETILFRMIKK